MDIFAKILLISWIIILAGAIFDHHWFNGKLLDYPYIGIILSFHVWGTVLSTPIYFIYFVIAVL